MRKGDRESLLAALEKAGIKTGFVKLYRLESRTRHPEVGDAERPRTDADAAYVVA